MREVNKNAREDVNNFNMMLNSRSLFIMVMGFNVRRLLRGLSSPPGGLTL